MFRMNLLVAMQMPTGIMGDLGRHDKLEWQEERLRCCRWWYGDVGRVDVHGYSGYA
ncbi:uncharacterized protein ACHE_31266A [Aspergillus chevalieri]|uniref:Uncharacterized protein n=1 Tax=Aspergillus chevalieri TaxID=182096 RepID=A0A7R7VNU3_ASPCH|nr:uncharacterized protein ACHE_31266A [Aspergillus chevalieri]BCR87279.1 hypothetical protein ACHE_31266A [Aspergillus chevalieri]